MKMIKKIFVIFSGAILVILGFLALANFRFLNHPIPLISFWFFWVFLSSFLFIVSGIGLFFFKKWAWKVAVLSYKLLFLHIVFYNIFLYLFIIGYVGKSKPHFFSIKNIIYYFEYSSSESAAMLLLLIPLFFIVILNVSKEEFGIEITLIDNLGFWKKVISCVRNNTFFLTTIFLILMFGVIFVKYENRRSLIRQVCKGECNTGPVPGPLVNVDEACYKKCVEDGYSQIFHFADWLRKKRVSID